MNATSYTVHCTESLGEAPHLSHAVMGNLAYNLLRTGVKLPRTLITGESVDKPILNALRLLGRLGSKRLAVSGPEGSFLDILATITDTGEIRVMAVNFNESFDYDESHDIQIRLDGLAGDSWHYRHYRIDREHSNAYTIWLRMGRPVAPSDKQLAAIQSRHGLELAEPESEITASDHLVLGTTLLPHSVSLWELDRT